MIAPANTTFDQLSRFDRLWLFLDYDGTLADFAPTPDLVIPDPTLIALLSALQQKSGLRLAIISGRRLEHIRNLIPIPGVWLAGTYGIELLTPQGTQLERLDFDLTRPTLEKLKLGWKDLIGNRPGFYLEDKGWSLAIHARHARDQEAELILRAASDQAQEATRIEKLRLQGGRKFLEICPLEADKGKTLEYILSIDAFPDALPIYIGDDDKDERAFSVIKAHQGITIVVMSEERPTQAEYSLATPSAVRNWLMNLLDSR